MNLRTHLCATTLTIALAMVAWPPGHAADSRQANVDPAGSWKVTYLPRSESAFIPILKLKLQGTKLTGTLTRRHNQQDVVMPLEDAKIKGSEVSFTVTIPAVSGNAPNATRKFQGQISGGIIQGKIETEWAGTTRTSDWEAKRVKE